MRTILSILVFLIGSTLEAHHSTAAEFDLNRPVTLRGVVTKLEWMNPHAWLYIDTVATPGHAGEHWALELGSPSELIRRGWKRSDLKIGNAVIAEAVLAKAARTTASVRTLTFADGTKVYTGFLNQ
ncbi:MAG: DUF6152 family protein [Acidobacteriota bacterium]